MQYGCDVIDAGGSDTTAPDESVRVPLKQEVMRSSELARLALKKRWAVHRLLTGRRGVYILQQRRVGAPGRADEGDH